MQPENTAFRETPLLAAGPITTTVRARVLEFSEACSGGVTGGLGPKVPPLVLLVSPYEMRKLRQMSS